MTGTGTAKGTEAAAADDRHRALGPSQSQSQSRWQPPPPPHQSQPPAHTKLGVLAIGEEDDADAETEEFSSLFRFAADGGGGVAAVGPLRLSVCARCDWLAVAVGALLLIAIGAAAGWTLATAMAGGAHAATQRPQAQAQATTQPPAALCSLPAAAAPAHSSISPIVSSTQSNASSPAASTPPSCFSLLRGGHLGSAWSGVGEDGCRAARLNVALRAGAAPDVTRDWSRASAEGQGAAGADGETMILTADEAAIVARCAHKPYFAALQSLPPSTAVPADADAAAQSLLSLLSPLRDRVYVLLGDSADRFLLDHLSEGHDRSWGGSAANALYASGLMTPVSVFVPYPEGSVRVHGYGVSLQQFTALNFTLVHVHTFGVHDARGLMTAVETLADVLIERIGRLPDVLQFYSGLWDFHNQPCRYRMQLSPVAYAQMMEHHLLRPLAALLGRADLLSMAPLSPPPNVARAAYNPLLLMAVDNLRLAGDGVPVGSADTTVVQQTCEQTPRFSIPTPLLQQTTLDAEQQAAAARAVAQMRDVSAMVRERLGRVMERTSELRAAALRRPPSAAPPLLLPRSVTMARSADWMAGASELNPAVRALARAYGLPVNEVPPYPPQLCNFDHHHWHREPAMQVFSQLINIDVHYRREWGGQE